MKFCSQNTKWPRIHLVVGKELHNSNNSTSLTNVKANHAQSRSPFLKTEYYFVKDHRSCAFA